MTETEKELVRYQAWWLGQKLRADRLERRVQELEERLIAIRLQLTLGDKK